MAISLGRRGREGGGGGGGGKLAAAAARMERASSLSCLQYLYEIAALGECHGCTVHATAEKNVTLHLVPSSSFLAPRSAARSSQ